MSRPIRPFAASRAATALAALAFFFLLTSYYIIRPVRDQLSGAVGAQSLPLFYSVTLLVMLALTPLFGALVARFRRKQLLGWSYTFFILCLLAFVPLFLAQDRIGARALGVVFYVWVSVFNLFVVSLFWSFMADIFDPEQSRLVFPLSALGGMAGAIAGPLVTKLLVARLGVAPLLAVSAAILAAALGVLLFLSSEQEHGSAATSGEPIGGSFWAGVKEVFTRPFLSYMALLMLLGDGIGTFAYAMVADYSKGYLTDKIARTAFYNDLDLYTNLLGVLLQLVVTPWLMLRRGPVAALIAAALVNLLLLVVVVFWGPGQVPGLALPMLAVLMIGSRGFAYGMTKPAWDSLYTRVPRETRYKAKNFIDTAVWRLGDVVVTGSIEALSLLSVGVVGMASIGVGFSALAVWVARQVGRTPEGTTEPAPALPSR